MLLVSALAERRFRIEVGKGLEDDLTDLEAKGLVEKVAGDLDGRRRAATLTKAGQAFEERISERLRAQLARSYRVGGLDGVAGVRQILSALAGGRMKSGGA